MSSSSKRILLVDNDRSVLASVGYNLRSAGYHVLKASNTKQARQLLKDEIVHLAIVDVRLEEEESYEDQSGLEFARTCLQEVPCIIFTAYEDKASLRKAFRDVKAKDSLDKKEPKSASELIATVDRLFESDVPVNFDLQIESSCGLQWIAEQIEVPKTPEPTEADMHQLFQQLFVKALALKIRPLLPSSVAPTLTRAGRMVLEVEPRYQTNPHLFATQMVAKLSSRAEIEEEAANYHRIRPFLEGQRLPVLRREDVAFSRQIGGLLYTLIGAEDWESICEFGKIYHTRKTEDVIQLMKRFFEQTFGRLLHNAIPKKLDLAAHYTTALNLTPEKLRRALTFHPAARHDTSIQFDGLSRSWRNPIRWAMPTGDFRATPRIVKSCLCHGDLHNRNILVDGEDHFWLIDFGRSSESHALRDFAELETDIKFTLLLESDLSLLLPFEKALLESTPTLTPSNTPFPAHPTLNHALHIILALRRLALDLVQPEGGMEEYQHALFWHTLNLIRLRHISPAKREHALLSAALICERF